MNISTTARISDQLDVPIIDHELKKMLLPKILDMFQYIKQPKTDQTSTTSNLRHRSLQLRSRSSGSNTNLPFTNVDTTSTTTPTTTTTDSMNANHQTNRSSFPLNTLQLKRYISHLTQFAHYYITPNLRLLWESTFQSQSQKDDFLQFMAEILFFVFTLGMGRPTPAMTLLGLRLIPNDTNPFGIGSSSGGSSHSLGSSTNHHNVVGKQRLGLLLFFSILLPKLYDVLMTYYLSDMGDQSDSINAYQSSIETTMNTIPNNDTNPIHSNANNDNETIQNQTSNSNSVLSMDARARIRRIVILRKIHDIVSKLIPFLRLLNYVSFLHSTCSRQQEQEQRQQMQLSNINHSLQLPPPSPPTLAMRLAGVCYANVPTHLLVPIVSKSSNSGNINANPRRRTNIQSSEPSSSSTSAPTISSSVASSSSSPNPQAFMPISLQIPSPKSINYTYAHRRLLYLEFMRSFWAVLPFSPSQVSQWNRTMSFSYLNEKFQEHIQRLKRKWISRRQNGYSDRTVTDTSNAREIASIPCTICNIKPIPIPYVTSCGHLYCYTCLRNAVVTEETDECSLFQCRECGEYVSRSDPL